MDEFDSSIGFGNECTFTGGNEPCQTCPRKITMFYRCGLLQDDSHLVGIKSLGGLELLPEGELPC